jgi:tRNA(fMet)-specific endonuclease VapC
MVLYMLDTDTASFLLRGKHPLLDARIAAAAKQSLCISAVTRGELLFGLNLKDGAPRLAQLLDAFFQRMPCLPWDGSAATHFAAVAADLHRAGKPIGSQDTMIAGHALAVGAVLVSNNTRHFGRVSDLRLENWSQAN